MKQIYAIFSLFFTALSVCSQIDTTKQFLYLGTTDIGIGTVQGIHPNLDNSDFGNYQNIDLKQSFRVKGIPFQFTGHLSNESLRIGKPSYFRLSYDQNTFKKLDKIDIQNDLSLKEIELKKEQSELYELEGKLSYQRELLRRLQATKDLSEIGLNDLPEIPDDLPEIPDSLNDLELPESEINLNVPSNSVKYDYQMKLDSLQGQITSMMGKIDEVKGSIDSLYQEMDKLKEMNLSSYIPEGFQLKRANIGLTSLGTGGLSNNAIPIHGFHVEGTYRKSFYTIAAGLSQPFQNFSTQVFDQITGNTQNVFNLNDFFNVNRMKFVSSEIVGMGDQNNTHLKLEHFYSGRSWEAIKNKSSEAISNTINLSGNTTFKKLENLNLGFLIGTSLKSKDSVSHSLGIQNFAYRGTMNYKIIKTKGELQSEYRSLGGAYDGVSQGLVINGNSHAIIGYLQKIGRHSNLSTRYMEDKFSKTDSIVLFNHSRRWMTQFSSRFNRYNKFQLSYSLIQGSGNEIKDRKGHLGTAMYVNEIKIGKNMLTNILQGGYTLIPVRIDYQEITQASISSDFHVDNFTYGLKGSYEKYIGIQQLWGENYILEPHIGFQGKKGELFFSYQYLKSQQFSEDHGFTFRANLNPSKFLTWQITGQRWLAKERNFFFVQAPSYVAPWYVDIKLIIHLNVQK